MSNPKVTAQGAHREVEYLTIEGAAPIGLYSIATRASAAKLVFVAGSFRWTATAPAWGRAISRRRCGRCSAT